MLEMGIDVKIIKHPQIEELVGEHYEVKVGMDTLSFIYKPLACHSYNKITENGKEINVATIDTMLSFFLAFLYVNKPYYNTTRIVCMCQYLFNIQQKNRLKQKGLLKRFNIDCIGKQQTLEEIKEEKSLIYEKLKKNKDDPLFQKYFFRYKPNTKADTLGKYSKNTYRDKPIKLRSTRKSYKKTRKSNGIFNWLKY
jgi:hypothetical protein